MIDMELPMVISTLPPKPYGGYCEGSTMYDEIMVVHYSYNPDELGKF